MIFRRFLLVVTILLSLFVFMQATPAKACSGYPYFGVSDLPEADLLIKATVIDADDSGHNAVLRVESYYKGEDSRFITVMRYPPALQTGAGVRGYDTRCLYAGRGFSWKRGSQGYFGLTPNGDGTFADIFGTSHFYPVDGYIYYQEGASEGYAVELDAAKKITEDEFIKRMLEAGSRKAPVPPKNDGVTRYPLMRFIDIVTKNGTRYQINPDRSIKKIEKGYPIAISADGAHLAFRLDEKNIVFHYIWTKFDPKNEDDYGYQERLTQLTVEGQAAAFSNDNNLVAVWNTARLALYMITNDNMKGEGNDMLLREIAVHKFAKNKSETLPRMIWSANGSTLTWQESNAIWHWNIFEKAKPQQLLSGGNLAVLMDISKNGRYIRVGNWDSWRLIDVQTRREYPNTIVSPNELFFIVINSEQPTEGRIFSQSSGTCKPPLRENCQKEMLVGTGQLKAIYPVEMELLGIVICNSDDDGCRLQSHSWHPAIGESGYMGGRNFYSTIKDFRDIRYDVQYQKPVVLVGDYYVYFGLYSDEMVSRPEYRPYLDIINVEKAVDSPIVSVEWGRPVFYDIYRLTSIEYTP